MADTIELKQFTPERLAELEQYEKAIERRRERQRKRYADNKETLKEMKKEWYEKNKERVLAKAKAKYAAAKEAKGETKKARKSGVIGNVVAVSVIDAFRGRGSGTEAN